MIRASLVALSGGHTMALGRLDDGLDIWKIPMMFAYDVHSYT